MNEIRLSRLVLRDFQGGTVTLDADGRDLFVFAANAMGKTRLVSAFTWLLFNKDALGRSDFALKNLDIEGEAAHGLEHSVEADLSVNGTVVNLKKVFREKWTKKRGSPEREFSGHTTEYFVDGVPLQEKLYTQYITDMTGDEFRFRLLTSPTTFAALPALPTLKDPKHNQRSILFEVCGDLSDADVIASNEKLLPITVMLGKRTLDDHRKIVTARRAEINREIEKIPVRIDEVRRGLPELPGVHKLVAEEDVKQLEISMNDAKFRLQGVNTGGNIADLTKKVSGLNADLRKMEDAHRSESLSTLNRLNQQISEFDAKITTCRRRVDSINGDLKWKDGGLETLENIDLPKLREKWGGIDAERFKEPEIPDTCFVCGRPLPAERVREAREKAFSSFNQGKAERLGEVDRKGQSLKEERNKLKAEIDALRQEREKIENGLPTLETDLAKAKGDRDTLKRSSEDFSALQGRADILDEIEDLEAQIKTEREGKAQDIEKIKMEIESLRSTLDHAKARVDLFRAREQGEKRMEELKKDEKFLTSEYEKLEGELYLFEQFIKTKVSMLTERINGKFEIVRFKLFNTLINGGIEDCCEITVNGVPFNAGLNNAARIQAGCDIIRTLQEHYGMKAPMFVDNREAVTDLPEMGCQVISLVVSPEDKELRIHLDSPGTLPASTAMMRRKERVAA
jgi:hypothetical protein